MIKRSGANNFINSQFKMSFNYIIRKEIKYFWRFYLSFSISIPTSIFINEFRFYLFLFFKWYRFRSFISFEYLLLLHFIVPMAHIVIQIYHRPKVIFMKSPDIQMIINSISYMYTNAHIRIINRWYVFFFFLNSII